ncbi:MAG TPA: YtxH domain-containing protein [Anaeromyxobacteraceae bacterium]|nr:YtxH domain-containing protein [Anaeromyxobacteraceae bacterium]
MRWSDLSGFGWKDLRSLKRRDILHRLGLEEHTPTNDIVTGFGLFAVGVLVGATLGIMFAPRPGAEVRSQLSDTLRRGKHRTEEYGQTVGSELSGAHPS